MKKQEGKGRPAESRGEEKERHATEAELTEIAECRKETERLAKPVGKARSIIVALASLALMAAVLASVFVLR